MADMSLSKSAALSGSVALISLNQVTLILGTTKMLNQKIVQK